MDGTSHLADESSIVLEIMIIINPNQQKKIKRYKLAILFPCESLEYIQDAPSDENDKEKSITHSFPFVCP